MKTFLLGLDGGTFSILDPLMDMGIMPFLKDFVANGVRGELLSTPNPLTPPAWTSVATGRSPGNHGIFDFIRPEQTEDGIYIKLQGSRDVRCETLWSMASRQEKRVAVLNFPLTYPPPSIAGIVIPGFVPIRHLSRAVYPPDFYPRMKALLGLNAQDLALDLDLEKKGIQGLPEEEYEEWIRFHIRRDQHWLTLLRYIMEKEPCDLTAIVFDGTDKLQHLAWRLIDPSIFPANPTQWEAKIHGLCLDYFRQLDGFLAEIVSMAGPEARFFIVSDHGFGPASDIFYLNVWLHQRGYLQWGQDGVPMDEEEKMLAMRMKTQYGLIDWNKTTAYALTPSSNGIYIRVSRVPGAPGIPPEQYEPFRNDLINALLDFADPETGEPIVSRVLKREDAFPGTQMHLAPDLTLVLRDHGFISILNSQAPLKRRKEPKGMHRPEGIFMASGRGIRKGVVVPQLSIIDVCPALLYSLDLPIPEDIEGHLVEEVFEPSLLALKPSLVREMTMGAVASSRQNGEPSLASPDDEAVLARLKALGYIE